MFLPEYIGEWQAAMDNFNQQIESIESDTVTLISNTFSKNLNSSVGAFDLLDKFKSVETRDKIQQELSDKFKDVLVKYTSELNEMEKLYNAN